MSLYEQQFNQAELASANQHSQSAGETNNDHASFYEQVLGNNMMDEIFTEYNKRK